MVHRFAPQMVRLDATRGGAVVSNVAKLSAD